MSESAQKQEHIGGWPPWAKYSVSGDYAVASFDPCSCQRGKPQKVVRKEVVRFGSRGKGRTADEAKQELIKKVLAKTVIPWCTNLVHFPGLIT